jgi:hypothetical protein
MNKNMQKFKIEKKGDMWNVVNLSTKKVHASYKTKNEAVAEIKEIQLNKGKGEEGKEGDEDEEKEELEEKCVEHKRLIKVLREGTPEEREAEAKLQEEDLKEYEEELAESGEEY